MGRLVPLEAHTLTSSSRQAIEGSFTKDGRLYPPELCLCDLLIIPEMSSIISEKEVIAGFLVALEEAEMRISYVKGGQITDDERRRAEDYGIEIDEEGRLNYRNRAVIWTATHTLDNLTEELRRAFVDRFVIVHLENYQLDIGDSYRFPFRKQDLDLENRFQDWLARKYYRDTDPDFDFAESVTNLILVKVKHKMNFRERNEFAQLALAYHELFPDDTPDECANYLIRLRGLRTNKNITKKDQIFACVYRTWRTVEEIYTITGINKYTIYQSLKRMNAQKRRKNGRVQYRVD